MADITASAYFPAYFRLDSGLADGRPAPLVQALDATLSELFLLAQARNLSIDPALHTTERQKWALKHFGLSCDSLDAEQVDAIYRARTEIIKARGTMGAIRKLLGIWAPGASCRKGWPVVGSRPVSPSSGPWRVGDGDGSRQIIFVRLASALAEDSARELRKSAQGLLPVGWRLVIAPPAVARLKRPTGIRLTGYVATARAL